MSGDLEESRRRRLSKYVVTVSRVASRITRLKTLNPKPLNPEYLSRSLLKTTCQVPISKDSRLLSRRGFRV